MSGEPNLELKVITLNINVGHNKKLMEECRTLREYAQYVDKVRRYSNEMELNTAVETCSERKHSGGNSQRISAKQSSGGSRYEYI